MATRLSESRVDHRGDPLPEGVYALVNAAGAVVSYKDRWRETDENGVPRQRSRSFSPRRLGSLDRARSAAIDHRSRDSRPIDLEAECKRGREWVQSRPFTLAESPPGPQREAQRRRRARARAAAARTPSSARRESRPTPAS